MVEYIEGWLSRHHWSLVLKCRASLYFSDRESRSENVYVAKNNTCQWIFAHETYKAWCNDSEPQLWIEGHAGVGKSTLLKHALRKYRSKPPNDAVVASHFFWRSGAELQKTPLGLCRNLLFQILPHFPITFWGLISKYEERERAQEKTNERWSWKTQELRIMLEEQLSNACQKRPITIFVDALDECPEIHREELSDFLESLASQNNTGKFKLCVSSRHYRSLYRKGLKLSVQSNNTQDIRTFVSVKMSSLDPPERSEVARKIITKANGLFQWAKLVCGKVLECKENGGTSQMIHSEIGKCPQGLDNLYESLIQENPHQRKQTLKLFQWICFLEEPLSLLDLRWILVLSPSTPHQSIRDCVDNAHFRRTPEELLKAVKMLSKGLLEVEEDREGTTTFFWAKERSEDSQYTQNDRPAQILFRAGHPWDRKVFLIHESLRDYLLHKGLSTLGNPDFRSSTLQRAHYDISMSCVRFILLEKQPYACEDESKHSMWSEFDKRLWRIFLNHIQNSQSQGIEQSYILEVFRCPQSCDQFRYIQHGPLYRREHGITLGSDLWRRFKQALSLKRPEAHQIDNMPLALAYGGITSALRSLGKFRNTDRAEQNSKEATHMAGILSRISKDNSTAIEFLPSGLVNLDHASRLRKLTPLHIAARYGLVDTVKCLLDYPTVDPNRQCASGETALHKAVQDNRIDVVRTLLDIKAVDPNIQDRSGRTALHHFDQRHKSTTIIQPFLASPRLDLNIQNYRGETLVFRILLLCFGAGLKPPSFDWTRIDPNIQNERGANLCHLAIYWHSIEVVQLLLEDKRVDFSVKNRRGDLPIFRLFEELDRKGQQTFYISLRPPSPSLLRLLLSKLDPFVKDERGHTLLHRAVKSGYQEYVQILLQDGRLDLNETDNFGRTPVDLAELMVDQASPWWEVAESVGLTLDDDRRRELQDARLGRLAILEMLQ